MRRWLDGGVGEFESRSDGDRTPPGRESRWRRSWRGEGTRSRARVAPRKIAQGARSNQGGFGRDPTGRGGAAETPRERKGGDATRAQARTRRSRRLVRAETRGMGAEGGGETRTRGDVAGHANAHTRATEVERRNRNRRRCGATGRELERARRGRRISSATWKSFRGRRTRCVVARRSERGRGERVCDTRVAVVAFPWTRAERRGSGERGSVAHEEVPGILDFRQATGIIHEKERAESPTAGISSFGRCEVRRARSLIGARARARANIAAADRSR